MADQRFSKLQKWILTTCYKVTVLLDNNCIDCLDGKRSSLCNKCTLNKYGGGGILEDTSIITIEKDKYCCITNKCSIKFFPCDFFELYREDILLSYFKLEKSKKWASCRKQHFKDCAEYRKAHVTLTRTLKTLENNEYVGLYGGGYSTIIKLTDKGATKAAELMGLEYNILPTKTNDEIEQEEKEHELHCKLLLSRF